MNLNNNLNMSYEDYQIDINFSSRRDQTDGKICIDGIEGCIQHEKGLADKMFFIENKEKKDKVMDDIKIKFKDNIPDIILDMISNYLELMLKSVLIF